MRLRIAALFLIASVLSGCADDDGTVNTADPSDSTAAPDGGGNDDWPGVSPVGPVATHGGSPNVGEQALLRGQLDLDAGCLYVTDADGIVDPDPAALGGRLAGRRAGV